MSFDKKLNNNNFYKKLTIISFHIFILNIIGFFSKLMSEQRYFVTDKEKLSFDNQNNFSFEFANENDPFSEFLNNSPKDESFFNYNDLDIYFHNNIIREINNEAIKDNKNEEINNNINNSMEKKYKNNPFVQNKVINEIDISRKENLEKKIILETTDLTNQKLNKNISQEKQNENINQINSNMNKTKSVILSIGTTQSIYINNNNFLGKKEKAIMTHLVIIILKK